MNKTWIYVLILIVVAGGAYTWYTNKIMPCQIPLTYRIGYIDPRFNLSEAAAKDAVADAEALWESKTTSELFEYDENATFVVNFKYDERQATTDAAENLTEVLEQRKELSDEVRAKYDTLLAEYETKKNAYESRVATYEARLDTYEADVAKWNAAGGAPEAEYERLNKEQRALVAEQKAIDRDAAKLNSMVKELNDLGTEGNDLAENYNDTVEVYNTRFGEGNGEEFTQGDYQGSSINIYEYRDGDELRLVLAHELGHALGIGHIENPDSIMYYLMEDQTVQKGTSKEDIAALGYVCSLSPYAYFMSQLGLQEASVVAAFQDFK